MFFSSYWSDTSRGREEVEFYSYSRLLLDSCPRWYYLSKTCFKMLPVTSLLGHTLSIFHFKKSNIIFLLIHSYQFWGSPWDHTDWIAICLTKIYNINKKWNDLLKINLRPHTGPCFSCSFIWTVNISLYLHAMSSLRLWTLSISQWKKKRILQSKWSSALEVMDWMAMLSLICHQMLCLDLEINTICTLATRHPRYNESCIS